MKKWFIKKTPELDDVKLLQEETKLDKISCSLLLQRGLRTFESIEEFFNPKIEKLHSPNVMLNMNTAVSLINKHINRKEKILIYGDYDVDGTTAVSLVYLALNKYYKNIDFYIPDRYDEGYGVSKKGIEFAKKNDFKLIITLDCGIKANENLSLAKEYGLNVIVCDHHEPGEVLPNAIILNPKQKNCKYQYKELTGCGVGFKFMTALYTQNTWNLDYLFSMLDLVCISIAADIVPVTGENRILAYHGLKMLNKNTRISIKMLLSNSSFINELSFSNIVFIIAPRINAAGRIDHAKKAVKLLLSNDENEIKNIAKDIELNNIERKKLDTQITKHALHLIESEINSKYSTVLFHESWSKGVIGIVASRLIEKHYKPTIVFTESDGKLVGSARSIEGLNIHDCIQECDEYIEQFGGHAFAAGITIKKDNFTPFKNKFEETVSKKLKITELTPQENIDLEISFSDLFKKGENYWEIPNIYKIIVKMEPFGPANDRPVFLSKNIYIDDVRILKEEHLKLQLREPSSGIVMSAIAFKSIDKIDLCMVGKAVDIVYTINKNEWNTKVNLQLIINDIKQSF